MKFVVNEINKSNGQAPIPPYPNVPNPLGMTKIFMTMIPPYPNVPNPLGMTKIFMTMIYHMMKR